MPEPAVARPDAATLNRHSVASTVGSTGSFGDHVSALPQQNAAAGNLARGSSDKVKGVFDVVRCLIMTLSVLAVHGMPSVSGVSNDASGGMQDLW